MDGGRAWGPTVRAPRRPLSRCGSSERCSALRSRGRERRHRARGGQGCERAAPLASSVPEDVHRPQEREVLHIRELLRHRREGEWAPASLPDARLRRHPSSARTRAASAPTRQGDGLFGQPAWSRRTQSVGDACAGVGVRSRLRVHRPRSTSGGTRVRGGARGSRAAGAPFKAGRAARLCPQGAWPKQAFRLELESQALPTWLFP